MKRKPVHSDPARVVAEYQDRSLLYHDFCAAMRNLLVSLLDDRHFKYQLSWRIKSLDSVREKIARNAPDGKFYRRLSDVEDLAGIRIVFYLESDSRRFLAALIREMTPAKLRMEDHRKQTGYHATHVLAQFGRKRLALNEYRRFRGLICEIQLTSALFNAWSEVEHDILYKRGPRLASLDPAAEAQLKRELSEAMAIHLQPASDLLESVARNAGRNRRHARERGHGHATGRGRRRQAR
jgi:ppGpp synthetase/RelA/SpoT-type nucleotidyltranferase